MLNNIGRISYLASSEELSDLRVTYTLLKLVELVELAVVASSTLFYSG